MNHTRWMAALGLLLTLSACGTTTASQTQLQCPPAQLACDGRCVDPSRDPNHCGECIIRCPASALGGPECVSGLCRGAPSASLGAEAPPAQWASAARD